MSSGLQDTSIHDIDSREQICDDLGRLFNKLNQSTSARTKRARTARGRVLTKIGHKLDALRRLDLLVALAWH